MTNSKKKLVLPAILIILAAVFYMAIFFINKYHYLNYEVPWINIVFTWIGSIGLCCYCLIPKNRKISYLIVFGGIASLNVHLFITDVTYIQHLSFAISNFSDLLNVMTLLSCVIAELLMLSICIFMLIVKFTNNRHLITGKIFFRMYAIFQLIYIVTNLLSLFYYLNLSLTYHLNDDMYLFEQLIIFVRIIAFAVYCITEYLAIWIIWRHNTQKPTTTSNTLENNLISLKQMYDNGTITEEEYNQKKSDIIGKL